MRDVAPPRGARVTHATFGPGAVVRAERGGRWLWVAFDRAPAMPFRVRHAELTSTARPSVEPAPPAPAPPAPSVTPPGTGVHAADPTAGAAEEPRHRALMILEAMRLGVVPRGGIRTYTVGREAELKALLSALDPAPLRGGRLRVVVGDYGAGKTHLMECMRQAALERGWAVARATLDGRETTPAHPRRVYSVLVRGLTQPGSREAGGLPALFDMLLAAGHVPLAASARGAHRYLDPALYYYARLSEEPALRDLLVEWIEGQPGECSNELNELVRRRVPGPRLLALPDYRTFAAIYAYLLGGIACLVRAAGAQGLCVLLDEAEFYAALGAEDRTFADNLFGCWALAALAGERPRRGEDAIARGGQEVHRRLPLLHRPDQPLACIVFLTPEPGGLRALDAWVDISRHTVEIGPLGSKDHAELYERVHAVYRAAHPGFALPPAMAKPMGEFLHAALAAGALANPRGVLKLLVEFLDVCRLVPQRLEAFLADLGRLFADEAPAGRRSQRRDSGTGAPRSTD